MAEKKEKKQKQGFRLFKPHTWGIIKVYRDFENYNDWKRTIKAEKADPKSKYNKWRINHNPFYNIYFTMDIEETEEQLPEQMGHFIIYGETEAEDERLEANMKMIGVSITEEDGFIFKSSDVKEEGIDYRLLNRKRKEMMNVYPEIFNYVGSYKAILNAINFFGYSDLMLIEYYKNIDPESPLYNKLKRVVIPDLLDREVEGYSYSEDLAKRVGYKKTNLMNLTYRITDEEGNNVNV